MDYHIAIDREITFFLRVNHMTQGQMAKKLGITELTFSRKRRGESEFKTSELLQVAQMCGKTPNQLLGME